MLPLPDAPYEACQKVTVRVSSLSLVRYHTNDYSVPTRFGRRQVLVKGYVHCVEIVCGSEVIAWHERSYERETGVPADRSSSVGGRPRSTIRCTTWRCWSTRAGLWIRPLQLRSAAFTCGGCRLNSKPTQGRPSPAHSSSKRDQTPEPP
jgi:hypothetical protein